MRGRMGIVVFFFVVLFFVVNGILFYGYQELITEGGTLKVNGWVQLWDYCSTDTFKTVSVSILLAVFITAIGGFLKIDKAIEERIRAQRQKRIETQTECIKMTSDMWNELYCLASEVRFFRENGSGKADKNSKKCVEDILIKLENFASRAEDVINLWNVNFPNLYKIERNSEKQMEKQLKRDLNKRKKLIKKRFGKDKKDERKEELEKEKIYYRSVLEKIKKSDASGSILVFINVLYDASISVAYYIQKERNKEKLLTLRNALGVIQETVKDIAHHRIINILKYFVEPLDGSESRKQEKIKRSQFESTLYSLNNDAMRIKQFEKSNNVLLSGIKTPEVAAYRKEADLFEKWGKIKQNSEKPITDYERYKYFDTTYSKIRDKQFIDTWEIKYSDEYLLKLATLLGNISIKLYLKDRARWL